MHDFLLQYGLFLAKIVTSLVALTLAVIGIAAIVRGARQIDPERLDIEPLHLRFERMREAMAAEVLSEDAFKAEQKAKKKQDKERALERRKRLYVLDFDGDLAASAVTELREEVTAILQIIEQGDEVLVKLESEGGMVHSYGLAASQLKRIRDRGYPLTVAVDKVAASGGYMMACVADSIVAAPFAVLGSIGVVAQLPNFNRLMKKHDIDYELHTAGEFKRTITIFGENTEAARAKFQEELEDTHRLFKQFVTDHRPQVAIDSVATGEHWFGSRAMALKLVDVLQTSDDYLLERARTMDVFAVRYKRKKPLAERLHISLFRLAGSLRRETNCRIQPNPRHFF